MSSVAQLTASVQTVLLTHAEDAARATKCVRRRRCFTGALWVQTLVLGCLHAPATTLTHLAQMAAVLGVAVSPQAIAKRFTPATVDCLAAVLQLAVQQRLRADAQVGAVLARFATVEVLDTTTIPLPAALATDWPGCGNGSGQPAAALKAGVRLDLRHGTLTGPLVESARTHDRACAITTQPLPAGSLRIADLGFWSVPELDELAQQGCFWLSRLQAQTTVRRVGDDEWQLDQALATTTAPTQEWPVTVGVAAVPARMLAVRVPDEVSEERRRRIRTEAKRRGQTPRAARLARAEWLLLVTNVPAERLSIDEAVVLARARWQIELLFKQWKRAGQLETVRSQQPYRVLAEVYAKLIGLVLLHWVVVLGTWATRNRSYDKAAQLVRAFAVPIAATLSSRRALRRTLQHALTAVAHSGVINPRRTHPTTYQLLLELEAMP